MNSGYAIRKAMTKMKGSRWSSESGSVYRVLRRLESEGYVEITGKVGVPNRERTEYKITATGVKAMQEWVRLPPEPAEWGYLVDPIRTRCYFLKQLPARNNNRSSGSGSKKVGRLSRSLKPNRKTLPRAMFSRRRLSRTLSFWRTPATFG